VRARKGVLITTSSFSSDAREYIHHFEKRIVLVDGATLASLLIQHNVGLAVESSYTIKKVDQDYIET